MGVGFHPNEDCPPVAKEDGYYSYCYLNPTTKKYTLYSYRCPVTKTNPAVYQQYDKSTCSDPTAAPPTCPPPAKPGSLKYLYPAESLKSFH
jgi:hypothetical protein